MTEPGMTGPPVHDVEVSAGPGGRALGRAVPRYPRVHLCSRARNRRVC